jgi:hypothetical protein
MHRTAHQVTYLYRTIHSWHHRLYVPYAFGALYNHPIEGFVLDTCGTFLAHMIAGLTIRQDILFFGISTAKTIDDHCGFAFPWDPFQHLFGNNADYHDIHRMSQCLASRPRSCSDLSCPSLPQIKLLGSRRITLSPGSSLGSESSYSVSRATTWLLTLSSFL